MRKPESHAKVLNHFWLRQELNESQCVSVRNLSFSQVSFSSFLYKLSYLTLKDRRSLKYLRTC